MAKMLRQLHPEEAPPREEQPAPRSPPPAPKSTMLRPRAASCIEALTSMTGSQSTPLPARNSPQAPPPLELPTSFIDVRSRTRTLSMSLEGPPSRANRITPFSINHSINPVHDWMLFHSEEGRRGRRTPKKAMQKLNEFEHGLTKVGSFIDWEQFTEKFGETLADMPDGDTAWLFKANIQPVWEDPANSAVGSGRWIVPTDGRTTSITLAGKIIEDICEDHLAANGIVLARKFGQHMVIVWGGESDATQRTKFSERLSTLAEGLEGVQLGGLKFKLHDSSKVPAPDCASDSDYETSPVLGGSMSPVGGRSPVLGGRPGPALGRSPGLGPKKSPSLSGRSPTLGSRTSPVLKGRSPTLGPQGSPVLGGCRGSVFENPFEALDELEELAI